MAVVIAYQSLNSNVSTTHNIQASKSQQFTIKTHDHSAQQSEPWMLQLPTAEGVPPNVPVHGPAQLLATAPEGTMGKGKQTDASFLSMVEGKALQIHQNSIRSFPRPCDLLVLGELDATHTDWASMKSKAGSLLHASTPSKACNCFSVHSTGSTGFNEQIAEGTGWVAVKCGGVMAVFVHVPNAIATDESAAETFYKNINNEVLSKGKGPIDIIMGDTNQPNDAFTPRVVTSALGNAFSDAHPAKSINPADSYKVSFSGTNSTATKKYDVAVYNKASIQKIQAIYISQFSSIGSSVAAVTDHMGICVYLEK